MQLNPERGDAMRMIVLAEEIGRALSDAADRAVLAMAFASAALALDRDAALWRINCLRSQ